ncbi:MAG TPA: LysR family transcriptional regulator [Solirubrobacteraceae bacterium]|nr:LysR family transcriptional regulator [Solirubrobacteraceae bacterium]
MELRQLRYLVALADERHFTRAAEREHIAQPALSQQIRRLEDELGVKLVERTTRRVAMTQAGELLVGRARRMLAELEAAEAELASLAGVQTGRLSVGALHTMGPVDLSLLLASFHRTHPGIELTVREQSSEELAEMLRVDEIDLAFLSVTEHIQSRGLTLAPLVSEEIVVVLPAAHPLARRTSVRLAELAGEAFISFRRGSRLRELLDQAAAAAGFEARIALESNESRRIRSLVSSSLGVAILPRSDATGPGAPVAVSALVEPALTRDVTLAARTRRHLSPAAIAFRDLTLRVFQRPSGIMDG